MKLHTFHYQSPLGLLQLKADDIALWQIHFASEQTEDNSYNPILEQCIAELDAYFEGTLREFKTPLNPHGTDFQKSVWEQLLLIPYGTTLSYHSLSKRIGNLKAIRAVGTSNGKNPIAIIIPCHRVIGQDGSLTGYAGGLENKKWLLDFEARNVGSILF